MLHLLWAQLRSYVNLQRKVHFNISQPYLSFHNIPVTTAILVLPQEIYDSLPIFFSICTLVEPESHSQD